MTEIHEADAWKYVFPLVNRPSPLRFGRPLKTSVRKLRRISNIFNTWIVLGGSLRVMNRWRRARVILKAEVSYFCVNVTKFLELLQNITKCIEMLRNVTKSSQKLPQKCQPGEIPTKTRFRNFQKLQNENASRFARKFSLDLSRKCPRARIQSLIKICA